MNTSFTIAIMAAVSQALKLQTSTSDVQTLIGDQPLKLYNEPYPTDVNFRDHSSTSYKNYWAKLYQGNQYGYHKVLSTTLTTHKHYEMNFDILPEMDGSINRLYDTVFRFQKLTDSSGKGIVDPKFAHKYDFSLIPFVGLTGDN